MLPLLRSLAILAAGALTGFATASAQPFPSKVIRIVTAAPGGGNDFAVRLVAPALTEALRQQVIIDNRGGSAAVPATIVRQAAPDGYTLLAYNNALWTLPLLQTVSYRPLQDFSPITLSMSAPLVLVVHPSVPVGSVKDLIVLARSKPGELNYGSGDTGGSGHLAAELFNSMAALKLVQVSYKGTGAALTATMAGEIQVMFPNAGPVMSHIKSGKLKALGVTSLRPSALAPGLTPIADSLAGYEAVSIYGVFGPARMPAAIVKRLNEEIVRVLQQPEIRDRYFGAGVEVVGSSPEQLAATVRAEVGRLEKVVASTALRVN